MNEQPMKRKQFVNENLEKKNFAGYDLRGAKFTNCTLSMTSFEKADLTGATFNHCKKGGGLIFSGAKMNDVTIENCDFIGSQFHNTEIIGAQIFNLDLSGSNLLGCRFDHSKIDGLNISNCNLNMSSFIDTQILSIDYLPVRPFPHFRGINLLHKGSLLHNHIFMNENEHLDFSSYCNRQATLERLFTHVEKRSPLIRPFALAMLFLFGLVSDYGHSFLRWLSFVLIIIMIFTVGSKYAYDFTWSASVSASVQSFFGFAFLEEGQTLFLCEGIIGYFMLGILIALITNKLQLS